MLLRVAIAAGLAAACASLALAQEGLFSRAQMDRGQRLFNDECASCHTPRQAADLMVAGGGGAPFPEFHAKLSASMPPFTADRPEPQGYVDILAYLARTLGAAPGGVDVGLQSPAFRNARVPATAVAEAATPKSSADLGWANWRGPPHGTAYSPADQITPANVKSLRVAWRWSSAGMGPTPEARSITTPLMVGGVLYATAGLPRNVVAIDARTGETLWMWRPVEDPARFENAPRKGAGRGVAYWADGKGDARIFTITPGFRLAALDAKTGRPIYRFGKSGQVDLMVGLRGAPKEGLPDIGNSSPPLVSGIL